ncbi:MAG: hypothetical protein IKE21_07355 [Erysipelotrichaceae bacterium]|nr:hypothetical protein [Erysipelotrichaceae bacterium]
MIRRAEKEERTLLQELWTGQEKEKKKEIAKLFTERRDEFSFVREEEGKIVSFLTVEKRVVMLRPYKVSASFLYLPLQPDKELCETALEILSHQDLLSYMRTCEIPEGIAFEDLYARKDFSVRRGDLELRQERPYREELTPEEMLKEYIRYCGSFNGFIPRNRKDSEEILNSHPGKVLYVPYKAYALYEEEGEEVKIREIVYRDLDGLSFVLSELLKKYYLVRFTLSAGEHPERWLKGLQSETVSPFRVRCNDPEMMSELLKRDVHDVKEAFAPLNVMMKEEFL